MYRVKGQTQTYRTPRDAAAAFFGSQAVATLGMNQWLYILSGETVFVEAVC